MQKTIVIVGGVAAGASCAARMRRLDEKANIVMLEKGEFISFANCGLPYYVGEVINSREELILQTPQGFKTRFNVDVRTGSEVLKVDIKNKAIAIRRNDETYAEPYDVLVLAPGCIPIRPSIPGIDSPLVVSVRGIPDADRIQEILKRRKAQQAAIIGGGFIGLEMAENLRRRGLSVTIIEMLDHIFSPADKEMAFILEKHLAKNGVHCILGDGVQEILPSNDQSAILILKSGRRVPADLIISAIGVKPDTEFIKTSGIAFNDRGAIIVDEHMKTNAADVYAVGDAVEATDFISNQKVSVPLAGPANKQGRIAADNIAGISSTYKNTQGTAVCKVFDLTIAVTGVNERNARRWNIPYCKSFIHPSNHAGYYPGASPMSIKLLFEPLRGRLIGVQIAGGEGVDKRIDVFASALRHGLTVAECAELELGYAPFCGSAKDPVNMAGFVAQNIVEGRMPVFYAEDIAAIDFSRQSLIDVRTAREHARGAIPGSINIPIDELRGRINELDTKKETLVYCQVGLRGYLAVRILLQHGFSAKNLSGGFTTFTYITGSNEKRPLI